MICLPHALQSALFGFVVAAHLEEENPLIVSFLVSGRGGGVYLCPGHDGSTADRLGGGGVEDFCKAEFRRKEGADS